MSNTCILKDEKAHDTKKEGAFVYILKCSDGSLYTGWTNDLKRRLKTHNSGKGAKYTRGRRPVVLVYWEQCDNREDALHRESEIKKLKKIQKIKLIQNMKIK